MRIDRRTFVKAAGAAAAGAALGAPALLGSACRRRTITGGFADDGGTLGHILRDAQAGASASALHPVASAPHPGASAPHPAASARHADAPTPPTRTLRIPVVIVGGGIAGLAAAWRLERQGIPDFVVLEMERAPGGNAAWGRNETTEYPWAAHYLPVPGPRAALVRAMCAEFGLLAADGTWDERHLCHAPQERLFLHGRWQEGLEPQAMRGARDHDQFRRFEERIDAFRRTGAFTIPFDEGFERVRRDPRDPAMAAIAALDRISFADWLRAEGFDSPYLHWYADYATRDDYGLRAAGASAYAGVHYFAAREGDERGPLTWPEGNGWLAKKLLAVAGPRVHTGAQVRRIAPRGGGRGTVGAGGRGWSVLADMPADPTHTGAQRERIEWLADVVIFAAPTFLLPRVLENGPGPLAQAFARFTYAPWVTANLALDRRPAEHGVDLAWDNVLYDSPGLGYVVATHQTPGGARGPTVFTYYRALADGNPAEVRRALLARPWESFRDEILADLSRAHPDLRECVVNLDVKRLAHAMIRPVPGFLFSEERQRLARFGHEGGRDGAGDIAGDSAGGDGTLLLANSDLSGLPLFEEAVQRGCDAADRARVRLAR